MGLIGGSFYKAAKRAQYTTTGIDKNDPVEIEDADIIVVALAPRIAQDWLLAHSNKIKKGAIVIDTCGIKEPIYNALAENRQSRHWHFIPAHPMAGKAVSGYDNSDADLFNGASVILTPYPETPAEALATIKDFLLTLGFGKIVETTPQHHDEMIGYTSQLCHIISSAYLREPLAQESQGYTAGSYKDMIRVGAPDPTLWQELFIGNNKALLPVLDRFISRLNSFRDAIAASDSQSLTDQLAEGGACKASSSSNSEL